MKLKDFKKWMIGIVTLVLATFICLRMIEQVARARPQAEQFTPTTSYVQQMRICTGRITIADDTAIIPPSDFKDQDLTLYTICSPYEDHKVYWPSNFVAAPTTMLRKGTCISVIYDYDANVSAWLPLAQPIIFESNTGL